MKLRCTDKVDKDYAVLPVIIRKAFGKQLRFLLTNRSHPSLHAKKYSKALDERLKKLEEEWEAGGYAAGKEELLARA
jgi:mRNA-degrading endonuclease RelE of RelBE toxin-antitoxin system